MKRNNQPEPSNQEPDTSVRANTKSHRATEQPDRRGKTVAIIQARLGSTRLPGKILLDIAGQSMLERVVSRVKQAKQVDEVVIATTTNDSDQTLIDYCQQKNWNCFRGSENDVLSRYLDAARQFSATRVVRVTSDCPLIASDVIDELVQLSAINGNDSKLDYCCNFYPIRRYPRGLDCETISMDALERISRLAYIPEHREHVTLYAYRHPTEFSIGSLTCSSDYSALRWTVDTPEDLAMVRKIYDHFESTGNHDFDWQEAAAACMANPEWQKINHMVIQKAA